MESTENVVTISTRNLRILIKSLIIYHSPSLSILNIFLKTSSFSHSMIPDFLPNISIAALVSHHLRGEHEHMCMTRCVCRSRQTTLTGTKQVRAKWIWMEL